MAIGDGSTYAPAGAPQLPNLLQAVQYAVRPTWRVAGVDYAGLGYASGTALKNPATISMAGVTVNTASKTITVTGNNVTLDGYDFSLNGGWHINNDGANTQITNSNFSLGSDSSIWSRSPSSNLYLGYCVIDCQNRCGLADNDEWQHSP